MRWGSCVQVEELLRGGVDVNMRVSALTTFLPMRPRLLCGPSVILMLLGDWGCRMTRGGRRCTGPRTPVRLTWHRHCWTRAQTSRQRYALRVPACKRGGETEEETREPQTSRACQGTLSEQCGLWTLVHDVAGCGRGHSDGLRNPVRI